MTDGGKMELWYFTLKDSFLVKITYLNTQISRLSNLYWKIHSRAICLLD